MKDDEVQIGVQVNDKAESVVTIRLTLPKMLPRQQRSCSRQDHRNHRKEIYVPGKIINIVCK